MASRNICTQPVQNLSFYLKCTFCQGKVHPNVFQSWRKMAFTVIEILMNGFVQRAQRIFSFSVYWYPGKPWVPGNIRRPSTIRLFDSIRYIDGSKQNLQSIWIKRKFKPTSYWLPDFKTTRVIIAYISVIITCDVGHTLWNWKWPFTCHVIAIIS